MFGRGDIYRIKKYPDKQVMLSRIWGLTLIIVGLYVAYELYHFPEPKGKSRVAKPSRPNPPPPSEREGSQPSVASEVSANSNDVSKENSLENSAGLPRIKKTDQEIALSVSEICEEMEDDVKSAKLPVTFARLHIHFREKRLEAPGISEAIKNCFRHNSSSPYDIEIEVFSSEFAGEAKSQVQLQVSIFNKGFKNKLYEVGRRLEIDKIDRHVVHPTPTPDLEEATEASTGFHPVEN